MPPWTWAGRRGGRSGSLPIAGLLSVALSLLSCATAPDGSEGDGGGLAESPDWIDELPVDDRFIYAVGTYHGALFEEDNLKHSLEVARAQLAQALRVHVKSRHTIRTRGSERTFRGDTTLETAADVENAEHVETWIDEEGVRGHPGQVWVLVRVPRD